MKLFFRVVGKVLWEGLNYLSWIVMVLLMCANIILYTPEKVAKCAVIGLLIFSVVWLFYLLVSSIILYIRKTWIDEKIKLMEEKD